MIAESPDFLRFILQASIELTEAETNADIAGVVLRHAKTLFPASAVALLVRAGGREWIRIASLGAQAYPDQITTPDDDEPYAYRAGDVEVIANAAGARSVVTAAFGRENGTQGYLAVYDPEPLDAGLSTQVRDALGALGIATGTALDRVRAAGLFAALAESIAEIVFRSDERGTMTYFNPSWYAVTGLSERRSFKGRAWMRLLHPQDRLRVARAWRESIASGREFLAQFRMQTVDGGYRLFMARAVPDRDLGGRIALWYGTIVEVDANRSVSATMEAIADAVPDPVFVAAADGQLTWFNRRWCAHTGASSAAARGDAWLSAIHPDDRGRAIELLRAATIAGTPFAADVRLRDRRGSFRWHQARASPISDAAGNVTRWLGIFTDIDEERRRAIRFAQVLQEVTLEKELPRVPGIRLDAFYEPGQEGRVGGDWYDAFRTRDGRLVIAVGDVAGGGIHAAATMAAIRHGIRGVAGVNPDPSIMLEAADRILRDTAGETPFVTAWVGVLDPSDLSLTFANAGHPAPMVRSTPQRVGRLEGADPPLGISERVRPRNAYAQLGPGDALLLFTNGLTDAQHDTAGGERSTADAFAHERDAADSSRRIRHAVIGDASAEDDLAILHVLVAGLPDEDDGVLRWTFATSDYERGRLVRTLFTDALRARGFRGDDLFRCEVAFGELLGNAVCHAPGEVRVVLDLSRDDVVVVHMIDRGAGFRRNPKLPDDALSETGRGLYLIDELVESFSVERRREGGSHVRAVLSRH